MRRPADQAGRIIVPLSWAAAFSAFGFVAANATGAVDRCNGPKGYAPVPTAFWALLGTSIVLAALAVVTCPRAKLRWLSLAGIAATSLVSLVVFYIGYKCGLFP